jgi:hypothetical protein
MTAIREAQKLVGATANYQPGHHPKTTLPKDGNEKPLLETVTHF